MLETRGMKGLRRAYGPLFRKVLYPLYESGLRGRRTLRYLAEYERDQWRSADEIQALQWRKLRALVDHCWAQVPFYREHWGRAGVSGPGDIRDHDGLRAPADPDQAPSARTLRGAEGRALARPPAVQDHRRLHWRAGHHRLHPRELRTPDRRHAARLRLGRRDAGHARAVPVGPGPRRPAAEGASAPRRVQPPLPQRLRHGRGQHGRVRRCHRRRPPGGDRRLRRTAGAPGEMARGARPARACATRDPLRRRTAFTRTIAC